MKFKIKFLKVSRKAVLFSIRKKIEFEKLKENEHERKKKIKEKNWKYKCMLDSRKLKAKYNFLTQKFGTRWLNYSPDRVNGFKNRSSHFTSRNYLEMILLDINSHND